jgi:hypothetical protein
VNNFGFLPSRNFKLLTQVTGNAVTECDLINIVIPFRGGHLLALASKKPSIATVYSDTSANEDNSFRDHIRYPKRDFPLSLSRT